MTDVQLITEGVFFTTPDALPKGRHEIPREQVLARQGERLMIAATELMADAGYRAIGVREVAARARVSRAAFYECFDDKDECVFAAYERFIAVLIDRVVAAVEGPTQWDATVPAVVGAYVDTLASDLVVAKAFQVEMDALGRAARERRRGALTGMGQLLKTRRDAAWPGAESVPLSAYVGAVYAMRQLVSDQLDDSLEPDLTSLAGEVSPWLSELLTPTTAAARPRPVPATAP